MDNLCPDDDNDAAWNDSSFLSQLGQVEAHSLRRVSGGYQSGNDSLASLGRSANKRDRIHSAESTASNPLVLQPAEVDTASQPSSKRAHAGPEGEYMAALRGNHSETWQAMNGGLLSKGGETTRYGGGSFGGGSHAAGNLFSADANLRGTGAGTGCYKCGKEGHWAKDCLMAAGGRVYNDGSESIDGGAAVPEKNCRCGGGICTVLTANTEKNPGRKFYRCPLKKEEGSCGFFEWCDSALLGTSQGYTAAPATRFKSLISELLCPCGAGLCVQLTAKTEKNMGRQFFRCPLNQGEGSCGFFKWCDEVGTDAKVKSVNNIGENSSLSGNPIGSSGRCFKCGMDGHWSKDCSNKPSTGFGSTTDNSPAGSGGMRGTGYTASGTSTCFKCGQAGHWSNNCPSSHPVSFSSPSSVKGGGVSGHCYKCGAEGHWSTNCPGSLGFSTSGRQTYGSNKGSSFVGGGGSTGSCYKCGGQGHWANNCTGQASGNYGNNKVRGTFGRD